MPNSLFLNIQDGKGHPCYRIPLISLKDASLIFSQDIQQLFFLLVFLFELH